MDLRKPPFLKRWFAKPPKQEEDEGDVLLEQGTRNVAVVVLPLWFKISFLTSLLLNVAFLAIIALGDRACLSAHEQLLYSPAQEAVEYEVTRFHRGFGEDKTIYQGEPSPEVDAAWVALYDSMGIIRMPKSQAALLPNRTYPYVGDEEGYYIGELAVFHQIHCLNAIRIALADDYYREILDASHFDPVEGSYGRDHISHCLDAVREAVMCASDISVITWKWNTKAQKALGHGDILHSCRSFDSIKDWAVMHRGIVDFRAEVYVEDELSDPPD